MFKIFLSLICGLSLLTTLAMAGQNEIKAFAKKLEKTHLRVMKKPERYIPRECNETAIATCRFRYKTVRALVTSKLIGGPFHTAVMANATEVGVRDSYIFYVVVATSISRDIDYDQIATIAVDMLENFNASGREMQTEKVGDNEFALGLLRGKLFWSYSNLTN